MLTGEEIKVARTATSSPVLGNALKTLPGGRFSRSYSPRGCRCEQASV